MKKENFIHFGIGAFLVLLFTASCWYAWYCGNQAYIESLEVVNVIDATTTEDVAIDINEAVATEVAEVEAEIKAQEEAEAAAAAEAAAQNYTSYDTTYSGNSGYSSYYNMPTSGLTKSGGVNYYDGRRETYYSSNVLYHYRTGEWTVDDEGFYRTSDGYYVVAASDMAHGTTFEGSKGTCVVADSGCAAGVTDYYVAW